MIVSTKNMRYKKEHMLFSDYSWLSKTDMKNPYFFGGQDTSPLDIQDGNNLLYFINYFVDNCYDETIANYQHAENMLRNLLPKRIMKRNDIEIWLIKNWKNHPVV